MNRSTPGFPVRHQLPEFTETHVNMVYLSEICVYHLLFHSSLSVIVFWVQVLYLPRFTSRYSVLVMHLKWNRFLFLLIFKNVFVFGCAGSSLLWSCSECGLLFTAMCGLLISVASLLAEHSLWGTQASAAVASVTAACGLSAHRLRSCGHSLNASQHVGFSQTRDQTSVPCIARWILNYWTTWEAGDCFLNFW